MTADLLALARGDALAVAATDLPTARLAAAAQSTVVAVHQDDVVLGVKRQRAKLASRTIRRPGQDQAMLTENLQAFVFQTICSTVDATAPRQQVHGKSSPGGTASQGRGAAIQTGAQARHDRDAGEGMTWNSSACLSAVCSAHQAKTASAASTMSASRNQVLGDMNGVPGSFGYRPGLQRRVREYVDRAAKGSFQQVLDCHAALQAERPVALDQDIDVTEWPGLVSRDGAKKAQTPHPQLLQSRQLFLKDGKGLVATHRTSDTAA